MAIGADLSPRVGRGRFLGIWAIFSNVGVLGGPGVVAAILVVSTSQVAVLAVGGLALASAAWMSFWARQIGLLEASEPRDPWFVTRQQSAGDARRGAASV